MSDTKELLRRARRQFPPPEGVMESLSRRRQRSHRNGRIAAVVATFSILVAVGAVFGRAWFSGEPVPLDEPTPDLETSTRFESPFYGYSILVPADWGVAPAEIVWAEGQPRRSDSVNAHVTREGSEYSFNILIASIAIPAGVTPGEWQLGEEERFGQTYGGRRCPAADRGFSRIEVDGVSGRVAYFRPAAGGCDLFATFVVGARGYVISTAGSPVSLHLPVIRSVLETIRFEPDRALDVPPVASAWRGIWPQVTRESAEEAQARADAARPGTVWQADWATEEGIVARRFLQQVFGWQVMHIGSSHIPSDAEQGWEAEVVEWFFIRCESGGVNPLYPDDPIAGDCAPTIGETAYQQVVVRTEQLIRRGRGGINLVTGWEEVEPYLQAVPPSDEQRAEALELIEDFMRARVAGAGADRYVTDQGGVFFLHAMRDGRPFGRYEIAEPGAEWAATWPSGGFGAVFVRLFPETGGGCVFQRIEVADGGATVHQSGFGEGEYEEGSRYCGADLNSL